MVKVWGPWENVRGRDIKSKNNSLFRRIELPQIPIGQIQNPEALQQHICEYSWFFGYAAIKILVRGQYLKPRSQATVLNMPQIPVWLQLIQDTVLEYECRSHTPHRQASSKQYSLLEYGTRVVNTVNLSNLF